MKLSTERILTTHVGSLPRPRSLLDLILAKEEGRPVDAAAFEAQSGDAVAEVVAQQVAAGVDIVSDGEMSKPSYATYVKHRVDGIGMDTAAAEKGRQVMLSLDRLDHPDFVTPTGFANCAGRRAAGARRNWSSSRSPPGSAANVPRSLSWQSPASCWPSSGRSVSWCQSVPDLYL
jgi:hypothetical protein